MSQQPESPQESLPKVREAPDQINELLGWQLFAVTVLVGCPLIWWLLCWLVWQLLVWQG